MPTAMGYDEACDVDNKNDKDDDNDRGDVDEYAADLSTYSGKRRGAHDSDGFATSTRAQEQSP